MARLTELSNQQHKDLCIVPNAAVNYAAKQHVMNLQASELAHAATCFPVFISRNSRNGQLSLSALASFVTGRNLFLQNASWQPVFKPSSLLTYPLYLMQSPKTEQSFTIGFDAESEDLADGNGTPLFTEDGKATAELMEMTKLLNNELTSMQQSMAFLKTLDELNLLKSVDLQVQYQVGQTEVIRGLYTINEERLQTLDVEQLDSLRKAGYLMPIHALLISLLQINMLINKHNATDDLPSISTVKIEVSKELTNQ